MPTPGPLELVIILVIALLVLGPGKLPDVGAALGRSIREFRKASSDIQEATRVDAPPAGRPASTPTSASPAAPPNVDAPVPAPTETRSEPSTEPKP
jgi:sec-independent protein translocase protein TatA